MELTIPELAFTILAASGGIMIVASMISRWQDAREENESLRQRVICRICMHAFLAHAGSSHSESIDCPQCGTVNERNP